MTLINFYKINLSENTISKEYYRNIQIFMIFYVTYFVLAYMSLVWIVNAQINGKSNKLHDFVFSLIISVLFLVLIPAFFEMKSKIENKKKTIVYEMCTLYTIPFNNNFLNHFKELKKAILIKFLKENDLYETEILQLELDKIRHEVILKRTEKNNKNYLITLISLVTLTYFINLTLDETVGIIQTAKTTFNDNIQFYLFALIFIVIIIVLTLLLNFSSSQYIAIVNEYIHNRRYAFYIELEEIICEIKKDYINLRLTHSLRN